MGASSKRIELTRVYLYLLKDNGNELVTNIQVGVTSREMLRRQEEIKKIDSWKKKRDEEQAASDEMILLIEKEWQKMVSLY